MSEPLTVQQPCKYSVLEINVVQPAIDHLKITVCRCAGSQCSSSPCRCNLGMEPHPRAPTMFWLIVPVSPGHLALPVILHITHIHTNKRHTLAGTHVLAQVNRGGYSTYGYTQTHRHQHTERHTNKNHFQFLASCVIAIQAQAVRQRSKVFITIDVRIHNKKWWLNLLQSVLFKAELLSPSCCSLSSVRKGDCGD